MEDLTYRRTQILNYLLKRARPTTVYTINKDQDEIAKELGITRPALASYLRRFNNLGLVRTGFGFLDITDKAVRMLEKRTNDVIIFMKTRQREKVCEKLKEFPARVLKLADEFDVVVITDKNTLEKIVDAVVDFVTDTKVLISVE